MSVLLSACKQKNQQVLPLDSKITVTDSRGKEITMDHPSKRLAVLFTPFVEQIYMLQAQDKLIGIPLETYTQTDIYNFLSNLDPRIKNKQIPTPTINGRAINVESVVALNPDLIVLMQQEQNTVDHLESLGYKVFTVDGSNQESLVDEFLGVASLLGKQQRAETLIDYYNTEKQALLQRAQKIPEDQKKSIYYSWSKGRVLSTSGKGSLMDYVITSAGAINACPFNVDAPNINPETLYKWNPDMMVLWNTPISDVYSLSELANLPLVKNRQVYQLSPAFYYNPHTIKIVLFSKQLQAWCYPEIYPEKQFQAELQQALELFYPGYKQ
ncbi:ABC transporter substrate-binding protein [Myroides sp. LJL119]